MSGFGWSSSGGRRWPSVLLLDGKYSDAAVGGTLNEVILASYVLPGNYLSANGSLAIETEWLTQNTAAAKTVRVRLGGIGGVAYLSSSLSNNVTAHALTTIWAAGAHQQYGFPSSLSPWGANSGGEYSSSVDTTQDQTIVITGQIALDSALTSPTVSGNGNLTTVTATSHGYSSGDIVRVTGGSAGSISGSPNVDPIAITKIDNNTFTYASDLNGTCSVQPTIARYPKLVLRSYNIQLRNP